MKDKRKLSIWIIIGSFLIVTTFHVARYSAIFEPDQTAFLSWPFAIAVDLAILACAYFTKYQVTARPAWVGYFTFTVMSGAMNIGWVEPETIAAFSYAIFPTLAIALLGWLFRQVDKLPSGKKTEKPKQKAAQTFAQPLSKREQAIKQLEKNTQMTERELAQILNVSTGSAHNYKKAFEQRNGK